MSYDLYMQVSLSLVLSISWSHKDQTWMSKYIYSQNPRNWCIDFYPTGHTPIEWAPDTTRERQWLEETAYYIGS